MVKSNKDDSEEHKVLKILKESNEAIILSGSIIQEVKEEAKKIQEEIRENNHKLSLLL